MSTRKKELSEKDKALFERKPDGPPPPPIRRKRKSAAQEMIDSYATSPQGSGSSEGSASSENGVSPETKADNDAVSSVEVVQDTTDATVESDATITTEDIQKWRKQLVPRSFKFRRDEVEKLSKMSKRHGLSQIELMRMGLLMAYAELESIRKRELEAELKQME